LITHRQGNKSPSDLKTSFVCVDCNYFYDIKFKDLAYIIVCLCKNEDVLREEKYHGKGGGGQTLIDYFQWCKDLGEVPDTSIQEFMQKK